MPTYEYRCANGHDFEEFVLKISAAKSELPCPTCGARGQRRMSAGGGLLFKGSGFYITDYGKDGKKSAASPATGDRSRSERAGADGASVGGATDGSATGGSATGDRAQGERATRDSSPLERGKGDSAPGATAKGEPVKSDAKPAAAPPAAPKRSGE